MTWLLNPGRFSASTITVTDSGTTEHEVDTVVTASDAMEYEVGNTVTDSGLTEHEV